MTHGDTRTGTLSRNLPATRRPSAALAGRDGGDPHGWQSWSDMFADCEARSRGATPARREALTAALVSLDDKLARAEYAAFFRECPAATSWQATGGPGFAPDGAADSHALATVRNARGALVMAGRVRDTVMQGGVRLGAFRGGPLTRRVGELAPAMQALIPVLRAAGYASVTLGPRWTDRDAARCDAALAGIGAAPVAPERQFSGTRAGLIALDRPAAAILQRATPELRAAIRAAEQDGFRVRPMTETDLGMISAWHGPVSPAGNGSAGPAALFAHARATGGIAAVMEHDGAPVGAVIGHRDGDRMRLSSVHRADDEAIPGHEDLAVWALIRAAGGREGLRGLELDGDVGAGFRPRKLRLPQTREFVLKPMLHRLALAAIARL